MDGKGDLIQRWGKYISSYLYRSSYLDLSIHVSIYLFQEIDSETMELLLNYIYTGQVQDFNRVSVVDLFKAADRYINNKKTGCGWG